MTINELGDLFTVKEYIKLTGRCKRLAYQDVKAPGFPSIIIGHKVYVVKSGFIAWIDAKMKEPKTA